MSNNIDRGWWIDNHEKPLYECRTQNQTASNPYYCIDCKRQWHYIGGKKKQLYYYYNLPSYGRKREICPECVGDQSANK